MEKDINMKKLVIQTQYKENYGWSEGTDHWKFKGGTTYVLPNCGDADVDEVLSVITPYIAYHNDASAEYILSAEVVPFNKKVVEDWETTTEFTLLGDEPAFMKVTDNREDGWMRREILEKIETWTGCLESDSGRKDYNVEFLMEDGDFCHSNKELSEWLEAQNEVA